MNGTRNRTGIWIGPGIGIWIGIWIGPGIGGVPRSSTDRIVSALRNNAEQRERHRSRRYAIEPVRRKAART